MHYKSLFKFYTMLRDTRVLVPEDIVPVTTMMGGWELSIPSTSKHNDLAWELVTIMLDPKIIAPWLEQYGYLPTQIPIGETIALANPPSSFPYL
jgi:multiple sugar transport system substrate-binding protein